MTKEPVQPIFRAFESREAAARGLSLELRDCLALAVQARGCASLVASGGSSPKQTYSFLAASDLPWDQITVVPSDERCVAADSARRNLGMIRGSLAVDARFVELAEDVAIDAMLPFDVVLLGMGDDGHTASLFPTDPGIDAALVSESNVYRCRPAGLPEPRISLTPRALLSARAIYLLLFGVEKRERYEAALESGPAAEYPVRVLLQDKKDNTGEKLPLRVFWAP